MIFQIEFKNNKKIEYAYSESIKKLQQDYKNKYGEKEVLNFKNVNIIYDNIAKNIYLENTKDTIISLFDALSVNEFTVINYNRLPN